MKRWASKCSEGLQIIPLEGRVEANDFTLIAESSTILVLEWIRDKGCLQACPGHCKEGPQEVTQRVVLSFLSSVFVS